MTRIKVDLRRMSVEASGHAEYAPIGQDIVCAGISTVMSLLHRFAGRTYLAPGYMRLVLDEEKTGVREVLSASLAILDSLAAQYPANVCIEYR